jgi:LmbE family N-acetylglucosaminyl deacetylase
VNKILLSPHCDDETLFASLTILRESPLVIIVFDSHIQPRRGHSGCDAMTRRQETLAAMSILGAEVQFLGFHDDETVDVAALTNALRQFGQPEMVYAPAVEEGGHVQHNLVGVMAREVFANVTHYMTYTNRGKSAGEPVPYEPHWPALKLKALSCYGSQIALKDNVEHFLRNQHEYYAA